jgi:hypothetical protein
MHSKSNTAPISDRSADGLVFVELPNGQGAWLRPEHHSIRVVDDTHWSSDERAGITDLGRDYLARDRAFEALFGPWPTVAEACGLNMDRVA